MGDYIYTKGMLDAQERFEARVARALLYAKWEITYSRVAARMDPRKWAEVFQGRTRKFAFVDPDTMLAYKADEQLQRTWMPIKNALFIRWLTAWDL